MTKSLHRAVLRRRLARAATLSCALSANAHAGPIYVAELTEGTNGQTITTQGAALITGLFKETQKGLTGWQSCRILLAADSAPGSSAIGTLSTTDNILTLQQGWAVVSVSYEPTPSHALDAEVVRPWVFITVGGVGAGAEGTEFIVEKAGNIVRIDTIAENGAHDVYLDIPRTGNPARVVRLPNNKHLEITRDASGAYLLNGITIENIADDAEVPQKARPANRKALLDAIRAKGDTVHHTKN